MKILWTISPKKTVTIARNLLIFCLLMVLATSCDTGSEEDNSNMGTNSIPLNQETTELTIETVPANIGDGDSTENVFRLSEGKASPSIAIPLPVLTGEPLTEEEIQEILARLPQLTPEPDDQAVFSKPEVSIPPPLTGNTIDEAFPAPEPGTAPDEVDAGPLTVIRHAPHGEIPTAPFINITFNQPMVPLNTLDALESEDIPVTLSPPLKGTWRWLGTKTLNFQYQSNLMDRLPMATEYQVTIPKGTLSVVGGELEETYAFTFKTPPPTLQSYFPSGDSQPLNPVFFIAFDQAINPEEVLKTVQVTANQEAIDIRVATQEEIDSDKVVKDMAAHAVTGRWMAFLATNPLPADAAIQISIGPDTPSAEGPLVTTDVQFYNFHTFAPLRIVDHGCSSWEETCRPLTPLFIEFNNPIDANKYDESMIRIDPEVPGASLDIFGNTIQIRGATKGNTTYQVTIRKVLPDIHNQQLGQDQTLKFKIGPAEPLLIGPDSTLVTLDPAVQEPSLSLYTINYNKLQVKIYAVQPQDWLRFKDYLRAFQQNNAQSNPPGSKVFDSIMPIESASDQLTEVPIDLGQYLDGDTGHFIVVAKPPKELFQEDRFWETIHVWVQITQIGIDAFVDHSQMYLWTNALIDGKPLAEVTIESNTGSVLGKSGEDGMLRFELPSTSLPFVVARNGQDSALLTPSTYYWSDEGWTRQPVNDELRWYVYDDRQMYRPGEEVHIKGWLREIGGKQNGDVHLVGGGLEAVRYQVYDPQGNILTSDQVSVNALGGFNFSFSIPPSSNLGYANIELTAIGSLGNKDGQWFYHGIQIQEFRRPEFEVNARNESAGPYFSGESATVAVEAQYYAGGPLPNAEVNWWVTSSPSNYNPPNWPDFNFGTWQPWWWYGYGDYSGGYTESFSGLTDATGNHYLNIEFPLEGDLQPQSLIAEATVMDVNRQAWTGTTSLLVHPADLYVGMRSDRYFVEQGNPIQVDLIVTTLDGDSVEDRPIRVTAARLEWKYMKGRWQELETDPQECLIGSTQEPVMCSFETPVGGSYKIVALISDSQGRQNQSSITRWVSGGQRPPSRKVENESITLIPDKKDYQPGDIAKILIQSPFNPAEGLLTVSRNGILYTERFEITDNSTVVEIPIRDEHIPNLNIQVNLVGAAPRVDQDGNAITSAPPRPAYATGVLDIYIPPLQRTLNLEITPLEKELEPGSVTSIDLLLTDANQKPVVDAELSVVVVDEAILALTNYQQIDPISIFYAARPGYLSSYYGRDSIILVDPLAFSNAVEDARQAADENIMLEKEVVVESLAMEAPAAAPMAEGAADMVQSGAAPIRVRSDFNPLAAFAPEIHTDNQGYARVPVTFPDNLTRYRIMVVAVDAEGNRFGFGSAAITARLPLMVRPSAPRFLNFGDVFEFPVVLQNQTDEPISVDVVAQVTNLALTDVQGMNVTVPANDRVEVRFPAETESAGTARFQIGAVSGSYADAASGELPVYTPATTEAFATYGVIDDGSIVQPIGSPSEVFPQFGGLEIQTSSTTLQSLTDAMIYLVSYPFECSEQLASRILGVASLKDVLAAFEAEGLPTPEEMESAVNRDIERLQGMQNWDGGFPYWRRGQDSIPFNTIHVAIALQMAETKGFQVPSEIKSNVLVYLQDIESQYPHWYSQRTRQTLSAYALYVRSLMGDPDYQKTRTLLQTAGLDNLSLEAVGWIWYVLIDDPDSVTELASIRQLINNRVVETAGAANFITAYDDQTYLLLSSDRRTDAILLTSLMKDNPNNDLIPKLVTGLLAHRVQGRWSNTQENVFVLQALDTYFNLYEAQTPDFVARFWLGETYAGEHAYTGRTTERHETNVPMAYLVDSQYGGGDTQNLIIEKIGTGRLYYRLGLRYAPTDLWLDPLDMGFVVQRTYEAVNDSQDVYRDSDGVWHFKAGAEVRVKLTMVADNRRYHVALVDPLPAGLEIVNPALAVSGSIPQDPASDNYTPGWWWYWPWYEHQNMRDDRAEAFTPLLWDGVYEYTYVTRATTPGIFIVPPTKAEEMYSPEVFGRSASDWVIVE